MYESVGVIKKVLAPLVWIYSKNGICKVKKTDIQYKYGRTQVPKIYIVY